MAIVIPAVTKHTVSVIFAHGLGDSGAGWTWLVDLWRSRNKFNEASFILPSAPTRPVTLNMGYEMRAWYDITSLDELKARDDENGISDSIKTFHKLIDGEVDKGIAANRVILGGFSQGGAISLVAGLTYPKKIGGIFGLSCYLLLRNKIQNMIEESGNANKDTKLFMAHGHNDNVVKYVWGNESCKLLQNMGYSVEFKSYPDMMHSAIPAEIDDLENYITGQLSLDSSSESTPPTVPSSDN